MSPIVDLYLLPILTDRSPQHNIRRTASISIFGNCTCAVFAAVVIAPMRNGEGDRG